jgi:hypothetical protein
VKLSPGILHCKSLLVGFGVDQADFTSAHPGFDSGLFVGIQGEADARLNAAKHNEPFGTAVESEAPHRFSNGNIFAKVVWRLACRRSPKASPASKIQADSRNCIA